MKSQRKIKISRKYRYTKFNQNIPVISPRLLLQGEWLKQAGFSSGQSVGIEIFNQMLIITVK